MLFKNIILIQSINFCIRSLLEIAGTLTDVGLAFNFYRKNLLLENLL